MTRKTISVASALAAGGAALTIAMGAPASAEPAQDCTNVGAGQVCDDTSQSAVPSAPSTGGTGGANVQNGPYGPSGNTPPVGN
ncbi:hypothetical protein [Mycolicibacterium grossiae]|uniref:Intersectin-EH binding protein Ibp1 n=1 Tax=Mycolicibacterium grossiae TaxID=1552759 RepID=A0A1E8Q601_9MYCO|nr:hypothetical protein [Mycolicibacterium grossiae]OFJ53886.1 hypothetical protein BEL07_10145 [Mycolicibacterium grossiae]QEM47687.1 hypothetical protein FZ046_25625 [Mycolicibacterium grossiae]